MFVICSESKTIPDEYFRHSIWNRFVTEFAMALKNLSTQNIWFLFCFHKLFLKNNILVKSVSFRSVRLI